MSKPVRFDSYRLSYCAEPYKYRAVISCYADGKRVGVLNFFSGTTIVDPHHWTNGQAFISFDLGEFDRIHSILLHEKPLYLYLSEDASTGAIRTDPDVFEPIGEEE
jgi:hypothetical protein